MHGGSKRSKGDGRERRKGKGKVPTEMERLPSRWPEAHTRPLALKALPVPVVSGHSPTCWTESSVPWELQELCWAWLAADEVLA